MTIPGSRVPRPSKNSRQLPDFIEPQLCTLTRAATSSRKWIHEVKLDGYRTQMRVWDGSVILHTRNGLDWTARYPEIAAAAKSLPDCILDGEVCAVDSKDLPDFAALLSALSEKRTGALIYFVFDCLHLGGNDLTRRPL